VKLHTGRTALPGRMTFLSDGYWFKGVDDDDYSFQRYSDGPRTLVREIKRMWGVSVGGWFIGIIRTKPGSDD